MNAALRRSPPARRRSPLDRVDDLLRESRIGEANRLLAELARRAPKRDTETLVEIGWRAAVVLMRAGRYAEAIAAADQVLARSPGQPGALSAKALALELTGREREAVGVYEAMVAQDPACVRPRVALSVLFASEGRFAEALAVTRPLGEGDDPRGRYAAAERCLQAGLWEEAWALYESRVEAHRMFGKLDLVCSRTGRSVPRWTSGEPPPALMLVTEQGMGDMLQFAGLIRRLDLDRTRVRLRAPEALVGLFSRIDPRIEVAPKPGPFDMRDGEAWSPLMSLPLLLGLNGARALHVGGYLAGPARARRPGPLRVGIAWQGNPDHKNDRNRSAPLTAFEGLAAAVGDISLVSLQQQAGTEQIAACAFAERLHVPPELAGPELAPFEVTAAIMEDLDAVVCVDTALAHLAGALGKPVFILLPKQGTDWRWLIGREDCVWYDSARLCRQAVAGDWSGPMAQAIAGLVVLKEGRLACRL